MSSKLFISLSTVALLGLSTVAYGNWIWYSKDNSVSKPEGRLPNGDCLELICKHGCVEDASNEYLGGCCPSNGASGGACTVDGKDVNACCQEGLSCEKGKCKATTCQVDGETYQEGDTISECSKCQDGKEKIDLTVVSSKTMGDTCTEECGCGNSTLKCSDDEYCCPVTTPTEGQSCHANCPCDGELHCVDGKCQKSCVKNVDWGQPCTDDCQCKDGTGEHADWPGKCVDGVCCYGCAFCGIDYCPDSEPEEESEDEPENNLCSGEECPEDVDCTVGWVKGHAWQYKTCNMKITLPEDGTWKFSEDVKVYVGDDSKCFMGIKKGATFQVSDGKITNYTGAYRKKDRFKAYYSVFGKKKKPKVGFTCNATTITVKKNVITLMVKVTPRGAHIHVPYDAGRSGEVVISKE